MPRVLAPLTPDPVIDALKRDVDRSLLRENLKLTVTERLERLQRAVQQLETLRSAFGTDKPRA